MHAKWHVEQPNAKQEDKNQSVIGGFVHILFTVCGKISWRIFKQCNNSAVAVQIC